MNLQNIPSRNPEFKRVRRAFVAPEGWVWVKADHSQIELRVLAQASQDPFMIRAFREGVDLHLEAARLVAPLFGVTPREARSWAKNNLSFARVYGASPARLVEQATRAGFALTHRQARELLDRLNRQSPRVEAYRREVHQYVLEHQESRTLFGRRRLFVGLHLFRPQEREAALREAFNHIVQGTAADVYKLGLVALRPILSREPDLRLVNMVHDEYDFIVRQESLARILPCVKVALEKLEATRDWDVPLEVEIAVGPNWADTTPLAIDEEA
jgi:DNA polymerase-1